MFTRNTFDFSNDISVVQLFERQPFDLVQAQRIVNDLVDAKKLYELWSFACAKYEKKIISEHILEELKDCILPKLEQLDRLKKNLVI